MFPSRRYRTNEVKEAELGCTCSTYQREYNVLGVLLKKLKKRTLTAFRSIWENDITMGLKEI